MLDILKVVIERVTSWPVAAVILGLIFKSPLSQFLRRVNILKGVGIEVSASEGSAERQLEITMTREPDPLAVQIGPQAQLPIPEDIAKEREAIRTYGGNHDIVLEQMAGIETHLARVQMPLAEEETARVLVRHLAVTQLLYRAESLYRVIFGSQIAALRLLNEARRTDVELQPLFERAKRRAPSFYGEYSFEDWIGFLIQKGCVLKNSDSGIYAITVWGQRFLEFLVSVQAAKKPH